MDQLAIFNFKGNEVRTVKVQNEPWFVLKDVCDVLDISNPSMVASRLDDDERTKFNLGRQGETTVINESGLYSVILRSDKPTAKQFKKWVTADVLPSIRKTGSYHVPTNPMDALKLMFQAHDEAMQRTDEIDKRVIELEENVSLTPGEYDVISRRVRERIRTIISERNWQLNAVQRSILFKAINTDIHKVSGIKTRTQLKQKHFDIVYDLVNTWAPSYATSIEIKNAQEAL